MKTTKLFLIGLCTVIGLSCAGCAEKGVTVIRGTVANDSIAALPGAMVKLTDAKTADVLDSSLVKSGKFALKVATAADKMYGVKLDYPGRGERSHAYGINLIPDVPKMTVTLADSSTVAGSPITAAYLDFGRKIGTLFQGDDSAPILKLCRETYEANLNNFIGPQALNMLFQLDDSLKLEDFEALYNKGGDVVKNNTRIKGRIEAMRKAEETKPGAMYKDIEGKLADGTAAKLSEYVGKGYVLLDFWASWCGPCMASIPELKELYAALHKKGLEIVGVNVWEHDAEAGPARAKEKEMTWPVLFTRDVEGSEPGSRHNVATDAYGVPGIPTTLLINPEGKIVERFTGIPDNFKEVITGYFKK